MGEKYKNLVMAIVLVTLLSAVIVTPVMAASYWLSALPSRRYVPSSNPWAWWGAYCGKESGCPETDMKIYLKYGDGYSTKVYNLHACVGYWFGHTFPPVLTTWRQLWYTGSGGSPWYYMIDTHVTVYDG